MTYSPAFFEHQAPIALSSARIVLPRVLDEVRATSVIDVGCGVGAWGHVAQQQGCTVKGVDGNVPGDQLLIDDFERVDLAGGYDCDGFDLAICLEVGEHLPESSSAALIAGLCKARYVLFSGAHPGQGGVDHVNEQWGTWWARLFSANGYTGSSHLKWRHWPDNKVQDFYRENLLLFRSSRDTTLRRYPWSKIVDVIHPTRLGTWP